MVLCLGEVISQKYALEYGTACLELHVGSVQPGERAIIIDDLVATDGTLSARVKLLADFIFIFQPLFGVGVLLFVYIISFFYFTCDCSMNVFATLLYIFGFLQLVL